MTSRSPKLNHAYFFDEKGRVIKVQKGTRRKGKGPSPRQKRLMRKAS